MRNPFWFKALMMTMVLVLGGALATAWASVPDKNGNVRTCYSKKSGSIRVLKSSKSKCSKKKERSLTLNAKGRTGARGARGPVGPVGPSNAFVVHPEGTTQSVSTTGKTVASLSLPAGSFAVNAQVRILGGSAASNADCSLNGGGQFLTSGNVNIAGNPDRTMIPLTDVVVLPAPASLNLFCTVTFGPPFSVDEIRIMAIKVGAAQVQGP